MFIYCDRLGKRLFFSIVAWSSNRDSISKWTVLMTIPENLHLLDCSRAKITHKDTVVVEIICRFTVAKVRLEVPTSDFGCYDVPYLFQVNKIAKK